MAPRNQPGPDPAEAPVAYVVRESFTVEVDGAPVTYRKGEPVHPDDLVRRSRPALFGVFEFPHPVKPRVLLRTPEVRAEG